MCKTLINIKNISLFGENMFKIGIDLGGTKIEGIILDNNKKELFRHRILTEQEHGYKHILESIKSLYNRLVGEIKGAEHTIGMGTPGSLSKDTDLLRNSNTVCLNGQPLKTDLEKILRRSVEMQNDANCFALAEAITGAGKSRKMVFGVIMGTGCGGGIVYEGKILRGLQDIAGEWGHMSINPNGPDCYCGSMGCVETYISGGGLQKLYYNEFNEKASFVEIVEKYSLREDRVINFMSRFFENYGRSMANLINILDPDIVILGGGLSNFMDLYTLGTKSVERYIFSDSFKTPIVKNLLGDSAGVIGAALMGI